LLQVKGLRAYFYGATPAYIPIVTEHAHISNGLSVPNLASWFSKPTLITSKIITLPVKHVGLFTTTYYVLCSRFDPCHALNGIDSCELLIFRKVCWATIWSTSDRLIGDIWQTWSGCVYINGYLLLRTYVQTLQFF
jgi:hypothetical protein